MPEPKELMPCVNELCVYYRAWYFAGSQVFQRSGDAPGMAPTVDICSYCEHFKGFDLYQIGKEKS